MPVVVTTVPTGPDVGEKLVIVGRAAVAVKLDALLAVPGVNVVIQGAGFALNGAGIGFDRLHDAACGEYGKPPRLLEAFEDLVRKPC